MNVLFSNTPSVKEIENELESLGFKFIGGCKDGRTYFDYYIHPSCSEYDVEFIHTPKMAKSITAYNRVV